jgi:ABC-2 type transport system permease protein
MGKNMVKGRSKLSIVLAYEFKKMVCNKTFVITTLLGPFLLAAVTVLPSLIAVKSMDRSNQRLNVGVYAPDEKSKAAAETIIVPAFNQMGWNTRVSSDEAAMKEGVLGKSLDGYLRIPASFPDESPSGELGWYSKGVTDIGVSSAVENKISDIMVSARLAKAGADEVYIRSLVKPVSVPVYKVASQSGEDDKKTGEGDFIGIMIVSLGFCMLIYMTVILYGKEIGRSVVSEKSSKIIDILLSSVRSEDLLYGKLLGIGLAGLLQYAVWIGFTVTILNFVGPAVHLQIPVSIGMDKFGWLVLFFIGGYLLYSSLFAACGAASEDEQHMAQLSMPAIFLLIIPMVMLQAVIQQPDSTLSVVFSYFPFTSPMVMMIRILVSPIPVWNVLISLGVLAASVMVVILIAARIFRVGIQMSGKNFSFKDIAAWIK